MPSGQAQKEFFVNEAHVLTDWLLHAAVEGDLGTPPANPLDGQCWLVSSPATEDWAGQEDHLACRFDGQWHFIAPLDGLRVLNRANGQIANYFDGWQRAVEPIPPTGGPVVDSEARDSISAILAALKQAGIFPAN